MLENQSRSTDTINDSAGGPTCSTNSNSTGPTASSGVDSYLKSVLTSSKFSPENCLGSAYTSEFEQAEAAAAATVVNLFLPVTKDKELLSTETLCEASATLSSDTTSRRCVSTAALSAVKAAFQREKEKAATSLRAQNKSMRLIRRIRTGATDTSGSTSPTNAGASKDAAVNGASSDFMATEIFRLRQELAPGGDLSAEKQAEMSELCRKLQALSKDKQDNNSMVLSQEKEKTASIEAECSATLNGVRERIAAEEAGVEKKEHENIELQDKLEVFARHLELHREKQRNEEHTKQLMAQLAAAQRAQWTHRKMQTEMRRDVLLSKVTHAQETIHKHNMQLNLYTSKMSEFEDTIQRSEEVLQQLSERERKMCESAKLARKNAKGWQKQADQANVSLIEALNLNAVTTSENQQLRTETARLEADCRKLQALRAKRKETAAQVGRSDSTTDSKVCTNVSTSITSSTSSTARRSNKSNSVSVVNQSSSSRTNIVLGAAEGVDGHVTNSTTPTKASAVLASSAPSAAVSNITAAASDSPELRQHHRHHHHISDGGNVDDISSTVENVFSSVSSKNTTGGRYSSPPSTIAYRAGYSSGSCSGIACSSSSGSVVLQEELLSSSASPARSSKQTELHLSVGDDEEEQQQEEIKIN